MLFAMTTQTPTHLYCVQDEHYHLPDSTPDTIDVNAPSSCQNYIGEENNNSDQLTDKYKIDTIEFMANGRLTVLWLEKTHLQLGCATFSQMQSFVRAQVCRGSIKLVT